MKKIIMWLIPKKWKKELRNEGKDEVMTSIIDSCYWFNNKPLIANTLYAIYRDYKKYGYWRVSNIRDEVFDIGDDKLLSK
jgi:hypothetical protein